MIAYYQQFYLFKKKKSQNFSCFYWAHSIKGGLENLWYLPHILNWKGFFVSSCVLGGFSFLFFYPDSYADSLHKTTWAATGSFSWQKCSSELPFNLLEGAGFSDLWRSPWPPHTQSQQTKCGWLVDWEQLCFSIFSKNLKWTFFLIFSQVHNQI